NLLQRGADQFLPVQPDLSGDLGVAPVVQTQDAQAGHRLAGSGLAHDAQSAAAFELERQPVDRLDQTVVGREVDAEVADLQKGGRRRGRGRARRRVLQCLGGSLVPHQLCLTLGSTTPYRTSTIRLANTTNIAANSTTPSTTGRSLWMTPS